MTQEKLKEYNEVNTRLRLCKERVKALDLINLHEGNTFFTDELKIESAVFKGDNAKTILRFAKTLSNSELNDAEQEFKQLK